MKDLFQNKQNKYFMIASKALLIFAFIFILFGTNIYY